MSIENPLKFLLEIDKTCNNDDYYLDLIDKSRLNKSNIYEPSINIYKCDQYIDNAYSSKVFVFDNVLLHDENNTNEIEATLLLSRSGLSCLKIPKKEHEKLISQTFHDHQFISEVVKSQRNAIRVGKRINTIDNKLSRLDVINQIKKQSKHFNTYNQIAFMTLFHKDFFIFDNELQEIPSLPIARSLSTQNHKEDN